MTDTLRERSWKHIRVTFPERQIYIRSDSRVHFYTVSPLTQAIFAGISLLFFGWVAFTSVNVIFKDRIIAAKEHHFEQMQTSYEGRIADLQLSYDELNGALLSAQDRFRTVADEFEAKQSVLSSLIEQKEKLRASLDGTRNQKTAAAAPDGNVGIGGAFDVVLPEIAASLAPPGAMIGQAPRSDFIQLDKAPFFRGAFERLGSLFSRKAASANVDNPAFRDMAEQEARVARLDLAQPTLLADAKKDVVSETTRLRRALQQTGINAQSLLGRVTRSGAGEGGPLLAIGPAQIATHDQTFNSGVVDTMASLNELAGVVTALNSVPLDSPTTEVWVTSGFGGRADPFTEELAFHSGTDLSAPRGADVYATAAGMVVFAGPRGAYGNTVEVDHGYGIRTRYGHLSKIAVSIGTRLERGAVIGKVGSTGRSTGPHVHYEVWYDNAVRDPSKFIKAGRDVRKE